MLVVLRDAVELEQAVQQRRVVFEHLLVVRDAPVALRRVAVEAAPLLVVGAAVAHVLERLARHVQRVAVAVAQVGVQQQIDGVGVRELRLVAEAAEHGVVGVLRGVQHVAQDLVRERVVAAVGGGGHGALAVRR